MQFTADPAPLVLDALEDLGRVGARLERHTVEHGRERLHDGAEVRVGHVVCRQRLVESGPADTRHCVAELEEWPERGTEHQVVGGGHDPQHDEEVDDDDEPCIDVGKRRQDGAEHGAAQDHCRVDGDDSLEDRPAVPLTHRLPSRADHDGSSAHYLMASVAH